MAITKNGFEIKTKKVAGTWYAYIEHGWNSSTGKTKKEAIEKLKHEWNRAIKAEQIYWKNRPIQKEQTEWKEYATVEEMFEDLGWSIKGDES